MNYFERTTPENVGMRSELIVKFLEEIQKNQIELHSLMIVRQGKCCTSGWWAPYGPEYPHALCSFSKAITSIAIGFAEQEGLLCLDERIADIFPEYLPEKPSQNLLNANLQNFLTMSCGHDTEIEAMGEDWMEEFFLHPFVHAPGTFFRYNTSGTNILAAVIKRKTGMEVTEYLTPRLFKPLGIYDISCDRLPGKDSVEIGGGAMKLCTESLAKFTFFLLKRGKWEGTQLLRESWFDRACTKQIETVGDADGHTGEWACGYGYQFWMCSYPGAFRADGAFGQFGIVFPDQDMIVVTTSATAKTQKLMELILCYLAGRGDTGRIEYQLALQTLTEKLSALALPQLKGKRQKTLEQKINNKIYTAEKNTGDYCSSLEILVGGVALYYVEDGMTEKMSFQFSEDKVTWYLWEKEKKKKITGNFDQYFYINKCDRYSYGASAVWLDECTLQMEIRRLDALSGARITFKFTGDRMTMDSQDTLLQEGSNTIGMRKKHTVDFVVELDSTVF